MLLKSPAADLVVAPSLRSAAALSAAASADALADVAPGLSTAQGAVANFPEPERSAGKSSVLSVTAAVPSSVSDAGVKTAATGAKKVSISLEAAECK